MQVFLFLMGKMDYSVTFPTGKVQYSFGSATEALERMCDPRTCIFLTDEHVAELHAAFFSDYKTIVVPAGEQQKSYATVEYITQELIKHEAHRKTTLIGVGGGVITDIAGFVAATYMRGISCGFIPTTLLAMVDAAIGGKNGINTGLHKNIIGTIRQPSFLIFDKTFLSTLPKTEWSNGFAEVIKYACLFDAPLFEDLSKHDVGYYQHTDEALEKLTSTCVAWKNKIVLEDEHETGNRKLLNFGHTAGHAIEKLYEIPHGYAVAIGMVIACRISENITGPDGCVANKLKQLLQQYGLPVEMELEKEKVLDVLRMDKKRDGTGIDYILLNSIGNALIKHLSFETIAKAIDRI